MTAMADVHPSSGQINQYEQDMMIENDYKNTIAKTGLTGKRQPNRETTVSPGNRKKRLALKESQPLNVVRRTKCCAENRSFVWRPPLRTEGFSSSKEQKYTVRTEGPRYFERSRTRMLRKRIPAP